MTDTTTTTTDDPDGPEPAADALIGCGDVVDEGVVYTLPETAGGDAK